MFEVVADIFGAQVYSIGIEPVGQIADQVSLVKDILGSGIRRWDPASIIDGHPQQLEALDAIQIFGLGKIPHVLEKDHGHRNDADCNLNLIAIKMVVEFVFRHKTGGLTDDSA